MTKEGIVRGLYAGTVPSLAANVAENSILFAAYGVCQKMVASATNTEVAKLSTFSNGVSGNVFFFFPWNMKKHPMQVSLTFSKLFFKDDHVQRWLITQVKLKESL